MKFTLRIAILSLTLITLLGAVGITPTSATSSYRKLLTPGRGSIESAEWHPSGKRIVVNTVMGAWFYDDSLRDIAHLEELRLAHFNATGDLLAAARGNQVVLFEAMTLTVFKALDNADGEIVDLRWSPDGKKLAVITDKPLVTVWEATTFRELLIFQPPHDNFGAVYWSPHSDKIATFDSTQTHMVIWEVAANQPQITFDMASMSKYYALAGSLLWNPDNTHILRTAFLGESSLFQNWDTRTGKLIYEKETPGTWMAFSADGKALALTSWFGDSRIVDPLTAESRRVLEQPVSVSLLGWSPDDSLLAGGGGSKYDKINGIIRVWNPTTGKVVDTFESHSLVQIMEWSPDSKLIFSVTEDNMLRILDVGMGKIAHERADHTLIGKTVAWSPDGSQIAVADTIGGVHIWDVASGQVIQTITDYNTTMLLAWQPTGTLLAIASYDDTWLLGFAKDAKLRIWDTITGQAVVSSPYVEDSPLLSLSWDRQGNHLIVTSYNSQFWLWDKNGLSNINWYKESGTETYAIVLDAIFSPDGKYILILANVCCAGPSPHIWDVTTHKFLQSDLHSDPGEVMGNPGAYAWNPAGDRLYMASWYGKPYNYSNNATPFPEQTTVHIKTIFRTASQDTATSTRALTLASSATWITSVVWNPDTTRIATTSEDKVLRVWDAQTGQALFTVDDVVSALWSPDGAKLAVHGDLPATRIVSAASGELLGTIDTLSKSVVWSPDWTKVADVNSGVLTIWGQE